MSQAPQIHEGGGRRAASAQERLNELAHVLNAETEVVEELKNALWRQRAGVAASDTEAVNASVDAIGRILLTLDAARHRRLRMVEAIAGDASLPLHRLEARARLRRAAEAVTQEVTVNRSVLRHAVDAGEAFLQALFSSVIDPAPVYGPPERPEECPPSGLLLNRRA